MPALEEVHKCSSDDDKRNRINIFGCEIGLYSLSVQCARTEL